MLWQDAICVLNYIFMKATENSSDPTGHKTLDVIGNADKFNQWMYSAIKPFCIGNILEIGSGIGNISKYFLSDGATIYLSDINPEYCDVLKKKFLALPNLSGISKIDLGNNNFDQDYSHLFNTFETVFALNVLEHIQDDQTALRNVAKFLKKGGRLIILVPAYPLLYCRFDKELGHYRRYTRHTLRNVLFASGFSIKGILNFNSVGIAGWFIFGKLSGRKQIEQTEMGIFNSLVPFFKFIDFITFRKIGLSLIIVATKPD